MRSGPCLPGFGLGVQRTACGAVGVRQSGPQQSGRMADRLVVGAQQGGGSDMSDDEECREVVD